MGQSPTREANRTFQSSQECPWPLNWARWIQSTLSHPISLKPIVIWSSHHAGLLNGFFPSGFSHKLLHVFPFPAMHATWSAHLTCLDFITLMFGEEYKSQGSSLCNFLPLSSKYIPQHPVFEPPSMSFHQFEKQVSHT